MAQRQIAIQQQIHNYVTLVPARQLQNSTPGGLNAMASHLAQQHLAAHTHQQQLVLSQQMAQHLQQVAQQQMMYGSGGTGNAYGLGSGGTLGGIGISTSSNIPAGSVWITSSTTSTSTGTTTYSNNSQGSAALWVNDSDYAAIADPSIYVRDGEEKHIHLPDGSRIEVARDGSYKVIDKDAKVTYRANKVRDFNRYINVSDRLEEFIKFCGEEGVRRGDMLELPLKLFIAWLAIEAAKADRETPPEVELLGPLRRVRTPRCLGCGQHLPPPLRERRIEFCSPPCFERHFNQLSKPAPMLLLPPPEKMRPLHA